MVVITRRRFVRSIGTGVAAGGGAALIDGATAQAASSGSAQFDAVGIGTPPPVAGMQVYGVQSGALVTVNQQGTTGHAMSVALSGVGGTSQAALNVTSANSAFSAVEVRGCETNRGTVKIAHVGVADGSDANAAALSIDLKTNGGTGTQAQGVFITSTTDSAPGGNAINIRYNGLDWFVVKGGNSGSGQGAVGVGVPIGHMPAGMVEIVQRDAVTPALYLRAPSGGPGVAIYVDASGNLMARTSSGNVRQIAAA
jgi:hypothetical protein